MAFTRNDKNTYNDWAYAINWQENDPSPGADPNHDNIPNLLAYYLDADPLGNIPAGMTPGTSLDQSSPGGPWLVFHYRENTQAGDVTAQVQMSTTLESGSWSPLIPDGVNVTFDIADPDPDGDGSAILHRVRLKTEEPRCFLRLLISR